MGTAGGAGSRQHPLHSHAHGDCLSTSHSVFAKRAQVAAPQGALHAVETGAAGGCAGGGECRGGAGWYEGYPHTSNPPSARDELDVHVMRSPTVISTRSGRGSEVRYGMVPMVNKSKPSATW